MRNPCFCSCTQQRSRLSAARSTPPGHMWLLMDQQGRHTSAVPPACYPGRERRKRPLRSCRSTSRIRRSCHLPAAVVQQHQQLQRQQLFELLHLRRSQLDAAPAAGSSNSSSSSCRGHSAGEYVKDLDCAMDTLGM
jgi:hypothetical protein